MPVRKTHPLALGLVLLAFCLIAACQTFPGGKPETITTEILRDRLLARQNGVKELKSFVRTTVEGKRRVTFNQVLLVQAGSSIRMDTLNMFGQTLGVFIHSPARTLLYEPARNRAIEGEAVWNAMERTVGMRIDFRRYAGVFLGGIPHLDELTIDRARLSADKKRYEIETTHAASGEHLNIEVDAYTLLPLILRRQDGEYVVRWEEYKKIGDRDFPHRLVIRFPARRETVTLEYSNPSINGGLPADAFDSPVPSGAHTRDG